MKPRTERPLEELPMLYYGTPCFVGLVALLGGLASLWTQACTALLLGFFLLRSMPGQLIPGVWRSICAFLIVCGLAFLPRLVMPSYPWMERAIDAQILWPYSYTPQPYVSLDSLMKVIIGGAFLLLFSGATVSHAQRKSLLWVLTTGMGLLALGEIIGLLDGILYPLSPQAEYFSFFEHSYQTALFFALGAILSLALSVEALRRRSYFFALGIASLLLQFWSMVLLGSGTVVLLFFLGVGLWFVFGIQRTLTQWLAQVLFPVLALLAAAGLVLGQDGIALYSSALADYFEVRWTMLTAVLSGDAFNVFFGVGLGNYEYIYHHIGPENALKPILWDWLMVLVDTGVVGLLVALVGLFVILKPLFPLRYSKATPYRSAAIAALLVMLLSTIVGQGTLSLGMWIVFVMLFIVARRQDVPLLSLNFVQRGLLRFGASGLILWGVLMLSAVFFVLPWHTEIVEKHFHAQLNESMHRGDADEFHKLFKQAIHHTPLDARLHLAMARTQLEMHNDPDRAEKYFNKANFVGSLDRNLAFLEGVAWAKHDIAKTRKAWAAALAGKHSESTLSALAYFVKRQPAWSRQVFDLVRNNPSQYSYFLLKLPQSLFLQELHNADLDGPSFQAIAPEQMNLILERWVNSRDAKGALRYIDSFSMPTLAQQRLKAKALARTGKYKDASLLMASLFSAYGDPANPADASQLDVLNARWTLDPSNLECAKQLAAIYRHNNLWEGVRKVSKGLARSGGKKATALAEYLDALRKIADKRYDKAWKHWESFERLQQER